MTRGRIGAVVAVLLAAAVVVGTAGSSSAGTTPDPRSVPVVMVHGYSQASCPGSDVSQDLAGVYFELAGPGWSGPLLPVSYYQCDTHGVDITGYGPSAPAGASATITTGNPRVPYTADTGIEQIAHDLAWFIYDTYTSAGTAVDLVGASMGGLVMRYALSRVAQADPVFPPSLLVARAVTISTPHAGVGTLASNGSLCGGTVQCNEMATDSAFIADLQANAPDPQGAGGTAWTVMGSSSGCDFVPASSTLSMTAAQRIDFTVPCYSHVDYLADAATTLDASATLTLPGAAAQTSSSAPHSLAWLRDVLLDTPPDLTPPPPAATTPVPVTTPPTTATPTTATPTTATPTTATPTTATPTTATPTTAIPVTTPAWTPPAPTTTPPAPPTSVPAASPDTAPPVVWLSGPAAAFQADRTVRVGYEGIDLVSGVAGYDVRYRYARWNGAFGRYGYPSAWQGRSGDTLGLAAVPGREYCFSVRARDRAGNTAPWTTDRCTAVALDDRALSGRGWSRTADARAYLGTLSGTRTRGAALQLRGAHLTRLALVVRECASCGRIGIEIDGRPWRTISTRAATTRYRVVLVLPRFSLRTATITLRNLDGRLTVVDGLALADT